MDKMDMRKIALIVGIYIVMFLVGFRIGEIYNRAGRAKIENIPSAPGVFYIVERRDLGTYKDVIFYKIDAEDVIMKFFLNPKLRPLLKERDISIYTQEGDKIY